MFHNLSATITYAGEELELSSLQNYSGELLQNLTKLSRSIFRRKLKSIGSIQNPFNALTDNLILVMEEKLLKLSADDGLKMTFKLSDHLLHFGSKEWPNILNLRKLLSNHLSHFHRLICVRLDFLLWVSLRQRIILNYSIIALYSIKYTIVILYTIVLLYYYQMTNSHLFCAVVTTGYLVFVASTTRST